MSYCFGRKLFEYERLDSASVVIARVFYSYLEALPQNKPGGAVLDLYDRCELARVVVVRVGSARPVHSENMLGFAVAETEETADRSDTVSVRGCEDYVLLDRRLGI